MRVMVMVVDTLGGEGVLTLEARGAPSPHTAPMDTHGRRAGMKLVPLAVFALPCTVHWLMYTCVVVVVVCYLGCQRNG